MSFDSLNDLVYNIHESLAKIELQLVNDSNILSKEWKEQLSKTQYNLELSPKLQIQKDVEMYQNSSKKLPPFPLISCSTSLKTNQIGKTDDEEKENYLKTAITSHKTDVDMELK